MRALAAVALVAGLLAGLAACDEDLVAEGGRCSSAAECGPGLLCDTAQEEPTCVRTLGPRPDLAMVDQAEPVDLAGADLAGLDLSASTDDLAGVDLANAPVDLSAAD